MRLARTTGFTTLLIALNLVIGACTGGFTFHLAPAPTPNPTVTVTTTTAVPATTTTVLPDLMATPVNTKFCDKKYNFCIVLPLDDGDPGVDSHSHVLQLPTDYGVLYESDLKVDHGNGAICPLYYPDLPRCANFDHVFYTVAVLERPGLTADQALAQEKAKLTPNVYSDVHDGTIRGNPAVFATFHTSTNGVGPYDLVWHDGKLYQITANGLTGRAEYAQQVEDSLTFTD